MKQIKIYEIPVYAFTKDVLASKVLKEKESIHHEKLDAASEKEVIDLRCYPYGLFDYNHIVGYIVISTNYQDVNVKLYWQAHGKHHKSRYLWNTSKKWFLKDQFLTGWHFRLDKSYSNEDIRTKIQELLDGLINEEISKHFFVDREAFDNINKVTDYNLLLGREEDRGQTQNADMRPDRVLCEAA